MIALCKKTYKFFSKNINYKYIIVKEYYKRDFSDVYYLERKFQVFLSDAFIMMSSKQFNEYFIPNKEVRLIKLRKISKYINERTNKY